MNETFIEILKYVIAPTTYLSLAIFLLWKFWTRWVNKQDEGDEDEEEDT